MEKKITDWERALKNEIKPVTRNLMSAANLWSLLFPGVMRIVKIDFLNLIIFWK